MILEPIASVFSDEGVFCDVAHLIMIIIIMEICKALTGPSSCLHCKVQFSAAQYHWPSIQLSTPLWRSLSRLAFLLPDACCAADKTAHHLDVLSAKSFPDKKGAEGMSLCTQSLSGGAKGAGTVLCGDLGSTRRLDLLHVRQRQICC